VVLRPETRALVDRVFGSRHTVQRPLEEVEFPLQGSTTVADLRDFYGIELDAPDSATLDQILHDRLSRYPEVDDSIQLGPVRLRVRDMLENRIEWVGLCVMTRSADARGETADRRAFD
jgi:potassium/hydrogen antiporter